MSRSRSFKNRGVGVGDGVGVRAFVYRLHSPAVRPVNTLYLKCILILSSYLLPGQQLCPLCSGYLNERLPSNLYHGCNVPHLFHPV
jgi:hypothetical protein